MSKLMYKVEARGISKVTVLDETENNYVVECGLLGQSTREISKKDIPLGRGTRMGIVLYNTFSEAQAMLLHDLEDDIIQHEKAVEKYKSYYNQVSKWTEPNTWLLNENNKDRLK